MFVTLQECLIGGKWGERRCFPQEDIELYEYSAKISFIFRGNHIHNSWEKRALLTHFGLQSILIFSGGKKQLLERGMRRNAAAETVASHEMEEEEEKSKKTWDFLISQSCLRQKRRLLLLLLLLFLSSPSSSPLSFNPEEEEATSDKGGQKREEEDNPWNSLSLSLSPPPRNFLGAAQEIWAGGKRKKKK